ncbi:hypothetical protein LIER_10429 [Lithospermum erythrorhizon]|uniref:Uncharacterized protein n=1 Tax=Lithospermum erythrorhizon TaxID=34254 RepID=A0AAV3PKJ2_LITER
MQASNSAHQFKKKPSLSYATTRMSESMRLLVLERRWPSLFPSLKSSPSNKPNRVLGVVLSPTRELSSQIYHVAQPFAAISIN